MKKLLCGTTALVGAGLVAGGASAADKVQLGVGGYMQAFFVISDEDDGVGEPAQNVRSHAVAREGEIIFNGSTTLDNGIKVGAQVQLEAEDCGDQIDESFIFIESSSLGRLVLGSENSAPYLMHYGSPAPSHWAHGLNSPNFSHPIDGANTSIGFLTTRNQASGDSEKLTYFTPRFAGFQFGVSYTPDTCEEATAAPAGCAGSYSGNEGDNDAADQGEVIEIGINYVNTFDQFNIALSAGYGEANLELATAAVNDDLEEWNVGASVGFGGFTVGAGYRENNRGRRSNGDQTDFNVGARYSSGPWGVGVQYAYQEIEEGAGLGEDEVDAFEVGGSYTLGPGIILNGGVQYWDFQDNLSSPAAENEATIFFIGTHVSF